MTSRIARSLARTAGVAILVAACGGNAATQAPGASTGTPTQAPVTPAATDGALPTFALPSFHGDVELEELFPDELGGEALNVLSMTGDQFMVSGGSAELTAALSALGKTAADLSVAFGGLTSIAIVAFQVDGVPGSTILDALFVAYQQEQDATVTDVTLGGKSVKKVAPPDGQPSYIYAAQDVVFVVAGAAPSDALLNETFSKLP